MRLARRREREPQRLLGAGLADRAGDARSTLACERARAARARSRKPSSTSGTTSSGASSGNRAAPVRRDHGERRRPLASAAAHEFVAVAGVALDREERLAARRWCGCRWKCRDIAAGSAPARSARIACAMASTVQSGALLMPPSPPSAAATASWSLNGSVRSPTIWPVSWPLPAISSTSPRLQLAQSRVRIASPRSPISIAPGAAARIAARIAAGSSLRGLSSVTITRSAFSAAIAPIIGRLPGSRSPPQPNTTTSLPRRIGPQRLQRLGQRVGLVGVVDEDRRAVRLADQFEPALGALQALRAPRTRARGSLPVAIARPAATSAFSTWKSPTSGSRTRVVRARHG